MDELINQISSRTGISEDQARQAVGMVVDFAKTQLPEPLASQMEMMLGISSGGGIADQLGNLGNLGGMFGLK